MPFRSGVLAVESILEAEFTASQIRDLARTMDVKLKGTSKSGYVAQISEVLHARIEAMAQDPNAFLQGLSNEQIDFVSRTMTARDPHMFLPRQVAAWVWARQYGAEAERRLAEMIDSLRRRALLFPSQNYMAYGFRDVFYQWLPMTAVTPVFQWGIQRDETVVDAAPEPIVGPSKRAKKRTGGADAVHGTHFLEDFDAFLSAVMAEGVLLRKPLRQHSQTQRTYWLTNWEHDVDEVERILHSRPNWVPEPTTGITVQTLSSIDPDGVLRLESQTGFSPAQCEFFWAITCALQLVSVPEANPKQSRAQANLPRIEEWLALTDAVKLTRAWTAWTEQITDGLEVRTAIEEATRDFTVQRAIGARGITPAQMAAEWCALRRYMVRVLRGVSANAWLSWMELSNDLFLFYPFCAWSFGNPAEWWFGPDGGKIRLDPTKADDWLNSVAQVLAHILRDSLRWFGALDVQQADDNTLASFRITEVGRWLLGPQNTALPVVAQSGKRAAPPITWSNSLTLVVPPAPERAELVVLMRKVAERGTEPFSYCFTPDSIEAALGQGIGLEQLTRQFEAAKLKLNSTLIKQFNQAAKRHGRVRVYETLTVVEFGDDFALRELSANTALAQHVVYQISPRAVVIHDSAVDELMEEMEERGYTPGSETGAG